MRDDPYEAIADDIRAQQRKLSPHFPTADEAALRLYNVRSKWAGRVARAAIVGGLGSALIGFHMGESLIVAGLGFIAFTAICTHSGKRNAGTGANIA